MRLDVRVEEGKGRVPSEIGTEPDRVGISDFIDGQTRGAVGSSGALAASSKSPDLRRVVRRQPRSKSESCVHRPSRPTGSSSTHSAGRVRRTALAHAFDVCKT